MTSTERKAIDLKNRLQAIKVKCSDIHTLIKHPHPWGLKVVKVTVDTIK